MVAIFTHFVLSLIKIFFIFIICKTIWTKDRKRKLTRWHSFITNALVTLKGSPGTLHYIRHGKLLKMKLPQEREIDIPLPPGQASSSDWSSGSGCSVWHWLRARYIGSSDMGSAGMNFSSVQAVSSSSSSSDDSASVVMFGVSTEMKFGMH